MTTLQGFSQLRRVLHSVPIRRPVFSAGRLSITPHCRQQRFSSHLGISLNNVSIRAIIIRRVGSTITVRERRGS